jgi:hypothetical protein
MKTRLLFISVLLFAFISCQKEEIEVKDQTNENITTTSPLKSLLERVSQNPTSNDNVLDNSSCFSVQLPVTVIVNDQNIVVNSFDDYSTVRAAIDAFSNDDDIVNFVYPITVILQNFKTVTLNDSDALDNLLDDCEEDDDFNEIDCIRFNYPIVLSLYDAVTQTPSTITIENNSAFFNFLKELESNQYMTISYPISVVNSEDETVIIKSNYQLENFIEDSLDDCNDNDPVGNNQTFINTITIGTWHVSYFFDDFENTAYFNGYNFTFNANGSSKVLKSTTQIDGQWSSQIDGDILKLKLEYQGDVLDLIEEDWRVIEFTDNLIRLKKSDSDNDNMYLYFSRN